MRNLKSVIPLAVAILSSAFTVFAQDSGGVLPRHSKVNVERFTSFESTSVEMEEAILDTFAVELQNDPTQIGYIIVYAGRRACAGEAQRRALRMKKYLVEHRGIEWNRVVWRDGGYLGTPYVLLEMQVRGADPYPYTYPQTLPMTEVKIRGCNHGAGRRKKHD